MLFAIAGTDVGCRRLLHLSSDRVRKSLLVAEIYVHMLSLRSLLSFLRFFVFYYLAAPTEMCQYDPLHKIEGTYYLLGKNLPGSGILYRTSLSALTLHAIAVIPAITRAMTAVFVLQLCGCAYHPPAGDQT